MVQFTVFKGSKEGRIVQSTTTKDVKDHEVLIKVSHSGVCGTDEHMRKYDMVIGHEGAGVVEEIGSAVTRFKKGDSVGWGYIHSTCNKCKQCITGHETLCPDRALYGLANLDQGSFASHGIWNEDYIYQIPDSIPREFAAPLMCGGATVFNALQAFGTRSSDRVGVIGVGGLGHLAIQFAAKMGCEVVVFSSTDNKREEAMGLGATEFIATKGVKELQTRPIDRLLVTASFQPDWSQYIPILAPRASIYPLSVDSSDFIFPYMAIIRKELTIQGSLVAARQVHREMLEFAARHQIRPIIEQFPMTVEGINEAMERLGSGKMRYRGVLIAQ